MIVYYTATVGIMKTFLLFCYFLIIKASCLASLWNINKTDAASLVWFQELELIIFRFFISQKDYQTKCIQTKCWWTLDMLTYKHSC